MAQDSVAQGENIELELKAAKSAHHCKAHDLFNQMVRGRAPRATKSRDGNLNTALVETLYSQSFADVAEDQLFYLKRTQ